MSSATAKEQSNAAAMRWKDVPHDVRDALCGKLSGLWGTSGGDDDAVRLASG